MAVEVPRQCWQEVATIFPSVVIFLLTFDLAGLQTLPTSGALHSHSVWSEPRPVRKARSVDALKKTNNSVVIILTVARLFWGDRKVDKARDWFTKAVSADSDYGDAWAWWYRFEKQHGTPVSCCSFLARDSLHSTDTRNLG